MSIPYPYKSIPRYSQIQDQIVRIKEYMDQFLNDLLFAGTKHI